MQGFRFSLAGAKGSGFREGWGGGEGHRARLRMKLCRL